MGEAPLLWVLSRKWMRRGRKTTKLCACVCVCVRVSGQGGTGGVRRKTSKSPRNKYDYALFQNVEKSDKDEVATRDFLSLSFFSCQSAFFFQILLRESSQWAEFCISVHVQLYRRRGGENALAHIKISYEHGKHKGILTQSHMEFTRS